MRVVSFITVVLLFAVGMQSKAQCPASSAVTVDGQADEWAMTWLEDNENVFQYNVCADEQNLYLRVKTSEFYAKRKMGAFGFTVWFDPSGKKKRKLGLKFPAGGIEAEDRMARLNKEAPTAGTIGERTDFQKHADKELISNLEVMELIGLADDPITSTRSGITNGIKVAIDMDADGAYVYELVLPFKSYRLVRSEISELTICFETGKYTAPKQKSTTKNSPMAAGDFSPSQLSRIQGYENMRGNPKLIYPTTVWARVDLKQ